MKKEVEGDIVNRRIFVKFTDFQVSEINAAYMDASNQLAALAEQTKVLKGTLLSLQAQAKDGGKKEDVECRVHHNYGLGRVEYISVETEMIIDSREMTPDDRQLDLLSEGRK